jgi:AcrR family transcriptional regulator
MASNEAEAISEPKPAVRRSKPLPARPRDAERTKAAILKAARDEFCARGFPGARVNTIAEKAKANKRLLYHYFGNKEALYRTVLHEAYAEIRRGEQALSLDQYDAAEAMDRLVRFTFRHFLANPWFPQLLTTENLQNARYLRQLPDIKDLHSPLVGQVRAIIARGHAAGIFRADVDPIQLYISIAALGYFYVSNIKTLSVIFDRDLAQFSTVQEREAHAVQMVLDYLRTRRT